MINALYSAAYDFPELGTTPRVRYLIAATPRSGSTAVCLAMWRAGNLGAPMEYLSLKNRAAMLQRLGGGDPERYWDALLRYRSSPNGVFGAKLFPDHLAAAARAAPRLMGKLGFESIIYFWRRDIKAQAVSYARAAMTRSWFDGEAEYGKAEYDGKFIRRAEEALIRQDDAWKSLFRRESITPYEVAYEDFLDSPREIVERIGLQLGAGQGLPVWIPTLRRQRHPEAALWRERYSNDYP